MVKFLSFAIIATLSLSSSLMASAASEEDASAAAPIQLHENIKRAWEHIKTYNRGSKFVWGDILEKENFAELAQKKSIIIRFEHRSNLERILPLIKKLSHAQLHIEFVGVSNFTNEIILLTGFDNIVSLVLSNCLIKDFDLEDIKALKSLESLSLSRNSEVTDAGLEALYSLPNLKIFNAEETGISSAALDKFMKTKGLISGSQDLPEGV